MKRGRPGTTPEAVTDELVSLATDLAAQKLEKGTASSQIITMFAQEGTPLAMLKRKKLEAEIALLEAKKKAHEDMSDGKTMMSDALVAFRSYVGGG